MPIFLDNFSWISINIFLAFLGLGISYLLSTKNAILRLFFIVLWFLFVANTIYLVTDLQYLQEQLQRTNLPEQITLIIQYSIVFSTGIITFFLSLYLFEKNLSKYAHKTAVKAILIIMIYLIAFGVILGKVQRINSWTVFTNPKAVINASFILLSSKELLPVVLIFGLIISILYFSMKRAFKVK